MRIALQKVLMQRASIQRLLITMVGCLYLILSLFYILHGSIKYQNSEAFIIGIFYAILTVPSVIALIIKNISLKGYIAMTKSKKTNNESTSGH